MEKQVEAYAKQVLAFAMVHKNDFDLVHAHDWMSLPAAMKIKQELGKPYIAHIHSKVICTLILAVVKHKVCKLPTASLL